MRIEYYDSIEIDFLDINKSVTEYQNHWILADWRFVFASPLSEYLDINLYDDIYRTPLHAFLAIQGVAGFDVHKGYNGCNKVGGQFEILDMTIVGGTVSSFATDFSFICEPGNESRQVVVEPGYWDEETQSYVAPIYRDPMLIGSIRINSEIPITVVPLSSSIYLFGASVFAFTLRKFGEHNNSNKRTQ